jgi:uracil-DNA glycosylase
MNKAFLENSWRPLLGEEFKKPYFQNLSLFLQKEEKSEKKICPDKDSIFRALQLTPPEKIKAVILGQDPYHGAGQANGLSFSVNKGIPLPPSLKNIFRELSEDLQIATPSNGDLSPWARQGVLLLNTILTVEENKPGSHKNKGWEEFTDKILALINSNSKPVAFVLWGSLAQKKEAVLDRQKHLILEAPHPSPLSSYRGFFGSRPFGKINSFLEKKNQTPIDWSLQ